MSGLVEFLRARFDEDSEVADTTRKNEQFVYGTDRWFASHNNAITSMAPHRAVVEVEAKRRILEEHDPAHDPCDAHDANFETIPCPTLCMLALPYAEHKDYREEWRP